MCRKRSGAACGAGISVIHITIIAIFKALIDKAVTARCGRTIIEAAIGLNIIGIVTGLTDLAQNTVTANSSLAAVGARIMLDLIAVVARFARIHSVVAAALESTRLITAVTDLIITVIASLAAINDTVAAAFGATHAIAAVAWI